jgi:hypothetical protein
VYFSDVPALKKTHCQKTLNDDFPFCSNGNLVFHWADFHETCEFMKNEIQEDLSLKEDYKKRETGVERLRLIPMWIRTRDQVYQINMYDLYESYILTKSHFVQNVDPLNPIEISFISGTGPFKQMAIAECLSHITYKDFIMIYLLKDKLPKRDFRVRLKAKVLMSYGEDFSQARLISLEQLTSRGLLLSMDWELWMEEVSQSKELKLLIETNHIEKAIGKNLEELRTHLNEHTFNLLYSSNEEDAITLNLHQIAVQSSFEFLKTRKVYLYIGLDKIQQSSPKKTQIFEDFISFTKEIIRHQLIGR